MRQTTTRATAPSSDSGVLTTILLILLAVMTVRDVLVRRWGSPTLPSSDVTQRSH
jgi:hypothetical protein